MTHLRKTACPPASRQPSKCSANVDLDSAPFENKYTAGTGSCVNVFAIMTSCMQLYNYK